MSKATNIKATLVQEYENKAKAARAKPGAFYYYRSQQHGDHTGIIHSCPCGCGYLSAINLSHVQGRPLWRNAGTRERPNLTPSVGIAKFRDDQDVDEQGFHWHGWLRDGVWVSV